MRDSSCVGKRCRGRVSRGARETSRSLQVRYGGARATVLLAQGVEGSREQATWTGPPGVSCSIEATVGGPNDRPWSMRMQAGHSSGVVTSLPSLQLASCEGGGWRGESPAWQMWPNDCTPRPMTRSRIDAAVTAWERCSFIGSRVLLPSPTELEFRRLTVNFRPDVEATHPSNGYRGSCFARCAREGLRLSFSFVTCGVTTDSLGPGAGRSRVTKTQ